MPAARYMVEIKWLWVSLGESRSWSGEISLLLTIKEKEGILDLYPVSGEYDFFMIVQAESLPT